VYWSDYGFLIGDRGIDPDVVNIDRIQPSSQQGATDCACLWSSGAIAAGRLSNLLLLVVALLTLVRVARIPHKIMHEVNRKVEVFAQSLYTIDSTQIQVTSRLDNGRLIDTSIIVEFFLRSASSRFAPVSSPQTVLQPLLLFFQLQKVTPKTCELPRKASAYVCTPKTTLPHCSLHQRAYLPPSATRLLRRMHLGS